MGLGVWDHSFFIRLLLLKGSSFPSLTSLVQSGVVDCSATGRLNLIRALPPFAHISQIPKCLFCSLPLLPVLTAAARG